jgi:LPXTG-site transpeptidase (sortase) family protein
MGAVRRGLAVALVVAGVGLASWAVADQPPAAPPAASPVGPPPVLTAEPVTTIKVFPPRRHPAAGVPAQVRIPELKVDVPVIGIDAPAGILTPPDDPQVLGWWEDGARPGALRGAALVTGHTVSVGGGALDDLETLRLGAPVEVTTEKGSIRYRVTELDIYRKASLARDAARVFSQTGPGRLVLITCEDWDGEKYLSNVVVHAEPVRPF